MNATFGVTPKTMNSTWRQMSSTITLSIKLKERCSRHDPVFLVEGLNKLTRYNYCNWEDGWYWIDDILYVTNDIQEVHCRLDPMATFRDSIANVSGYCVYGDVSHWDDEIEDIRFCPDNILHKYVNGNECLIEGKPDFWEWDEGTVVLDVIETTPNSGFKKYAMALSTFSSAMYQLNLSTMDAAVAAVKGSGTWTNVQTQAGQDLASIIAALGGNASWQECIIKATWLPIAIREYNDISASPGNPVFKIRIGAVEVPLINGAYPITTIGAWIDSKLSIGQNLVFGNNTVVDDLRFLKNPRWISLQIHTPAGVQSINDVMLRESTSWPLHEVTTIDMLTGKWHMEFNTHYTDAGGTVKNRNGVTLARFEGNCSIDITQWLSSKGNGTLWVAGAMSKIIPAVISEGATTVVDSVKTNNKDISKTSTISPSYTAAGNPSIRNNYSDSVIDKSQVITNEHSVTTGKKSTPFPTIQTGMREFMSSGVNYTDYIFANWGGAGTAPKLGFIIIAIQWGPNSFVDDADPYEAYLDYCNLYGYPVNKYVQVGDCEDKSYLQFSNTFMHYCPGATDDDKKIINYFLNDGFIWERIET